MNTCPDCGGAWVGDGFTTAVHCEHAEPLFDVEPDSGPWSCQRTQAYLKGRETKRLTDNCVLPLSITHE